MPIDRPLDRPIDRPIDRMVDWELAVRAAGLASGAPPVLPTAEAAEVVDALRAAAATATDHVREVTRLSAPDPAPGSVLVVDRRGWARVNARSLRELLEPVVAARWEDRAYRPPEVLTAVGSRVSAVQIGVVLGLLAGRVLGQYEPGWTEGSRVGRLVLVAPNVVAVGRELGAAPEAFRLWVCLHEETHRVQFEAHPWLGDHLRTQVRSLVGDLIGGEELAERFQRLVEAVPKVARGERRPANLLELIQSPDQRAALARLSATMSLLEGHADVVMDAVGPQVVPGVQEIRRRFAERRKPRHLADRILRSVLGLEQKMRQYSEGARFVRKVVDVAGIDGFNTVWSGLECLPSAEEILAPERWLARVAPVAGSADGSMTGPRPDSTDSP